MTDLENDGLPVFVTAVEHSYCDCCKHKHMKRTFCITSPLMEDFHLGYVCAGKWFKVNLSGNISRARRILQNKMNSMPYVELMRTLDLIVSERDKNIAEEDM